VISALVFCIPLYLDLHEDGDLSVETCRKVNLMYDL